MGFVGTCSCAYHKFFAFVDVGCPDEGLHNNKIFTFSMIFTVSFVFSMCMARCMAFGHMVGKEECHHGCHIRCLDKDERCRSKQTHEQSFCCSAFSTMFRPHIGLSKGGGG